MWQWQEPKDLGALYDDMGTTTGLVRVTATE